MNIFTKLALLSFLASVAIGLVGIAANLPAEGPLYATAWGLDIAGFVLFILGVGVDD